MKIVVYGLLYYLLNLALIDKHIASMLKRRRSFLFLYFICRQTSTIGIGLESLSLFYELNKRIE